MYYIGVDLGGTNIAVGVVSEYGEIMLKKSAPTLAGRSVGELVKDIAALCKEVVSELKLDFGEIASIGIGSPGTIDPINGKIIFSGNLYLTDANVRFEMEKYFIVPISLGNDANCAALGESVAGAAKGCKTSVTITLGTGIGSGIIIDGKIYSGPFYGAGEMGHHTIVVDGEQCTCGKRGCWEAYSSATALIRDGKAAAEKNPDSKILKLAGGDISNINGKTIFDAKDEGDETANVVVNQYIKYLAEGIANTINIFQPEIIAIGGGVSAQGEKLLGPLREQTKELVFASDLKTKIVTVKLGNDAGIVGAAMLNREM